MKFAFSSFAHRFVCLFMCCEFSIHFIIYFFFLHREGKLANREFVQAPCISCMGIQFTLLFFVAFSISFWFSSSTFVALQFWGQGYIRNAEKYVWHYSFTDFSNCEKLLWLFYKLDLAAKFISKGNYVFRIFPRLVGLGFAFHTQMESIKMTKLFIILMNFLAIFPSCKYFRREITNCGRLPWWKGWTDEANSILKAGTLKVPRVHQLEWKSTQNLLVFPPVSDGLKS